MNIEMVLADVSNRCRNTREATRFEAARFVIHYPTQLAPYLIGCCLEHCEEDGFILYSMLPATYQVGISDPDKEKLQRSHVPFLSPCCYSKGHTRKCASLMATYSLLIVT